MHISYMYSIANHLYLTTCIANYELGMHNCHRLCLSTYPYIAIAEYLQKLLSYRVLVYSVNFVALIRLPIASYILLIYIRSYSDKRLNQL